MIISRTPLRISFAGGGSDLPAFYCQENGAVVSTAINKYIYIVVNRKFDEKIRASYSQTEIVDTIDELHHELIREALKLRGIKGGIEVTSISDIPSRGTGLGSSSSYTVGLLNALYAYTGSNVDPERLAMEACEIEIERCEKVLGKQDQYIAAYGGFQFIRFNRDESVYIDPIICKPETRKALNEGMLMLYTGLTRSSTGILEEQSANTNSNPQNRALLRKMVELAYQLRDALQANDLVAFGDILHAGWIAKRQLAQHVTSEKIDAWYERARRTGALGGKLLGAGGGGFLLFYAPPERHEDIVRALPELRAVPFVFEPQGSKIVYIEENGLSRDSKLYQRAWLSSNKVNAVFQKQPVAEL
ncbi:MAG: GHMP kinase [Chloroflexi bacterium]|nr:GHMP kinase [Chloroflexota bacterium]